MKIKVLVCDDQIILSQGIKSVLETSDELDIVGIACDGLDCLKKVEETHPDVVLLDIRMPNMNGVVATKEIKEKYPETKVIILTTFDDSEYILNAINNGASGYLLKDIGSTALVDAIKNAYAGDTILPSKIARKIAEASRNIANDRQITLRKKFNLSDREVEIALMIYEGFTNRQIASALKLSEGTARNYISSIYEKFGCDNRAGAINILKNIL